MKRLKQKEGASHRGKNCGVWHQKQNFKANFDNMVTMETIFKKHNNWFETERF